jgi:hypothetical protein
MTELDPDTRRVFWWRLVVSAFITSGVVFVFWAMGGLYGTQGFAYADDVDTKIMRAVAPVNAKLKMIETEQTTQSGYLKRLVKSDLERLIDREILARCNATTSAEKRRIKSAIDAYQSDYEDVFETEYDEPECADL